MWAATQDIRSGQPLFVVRHLQRTAKMAATTRHLHIKSMPPAERQKFDLNSERALVRIAAGLLRAPFDDEQDR